MFYKFCWLVMVLLWKMCSSGEFYHEQDALCCGDKLYPKGADGRAEYGCCDKRLYNLTSQMCCGNKIHDVHPEEKGSVECCGDQKINMTSTLCCRHDYVWSKGKVATQHTRYPGIECCGDKPFESIRKKCRWNRKNEPVLVHMYEEICEGRVISLKEQSCCLNKIWNTPAVHPNDWRQPNPNSSCCGRTIYNPNVNKCCPAHYTVVPKGDHIKCCGNGSADLQYQMCCEGKVHDVRSSNDVCCGPHRINNNSEACCVWQPYDPNTEKCCQAIGFGNPVKKGETCCGAQKLLENELCCHGNRVLKARDDDNDCCYDQMRDTFYPFNNKIKMCANGIPVTRKLKHKLCGRTFYTDAEGVCCNNKLWKHPDNAKYQCCGVLGEVYNENTQMCCNGVVQQMSINQGECCKEKAYSFFDHQNPCKKKCGSSHYDTQSRICCGRKTYHKDKDGDECCGNRPYFASEKTCCKTKLYDRAYGFCCGEDIYNRKTHRCCGGYELTPRKSSKKDRKRCCRNKFAYDRRYGTCKETGLIKPRRKMSHVKNICRKSTWRNLNNIEAEMCWRKFAIEGTIVSHEYSRNKLTIIMKNVQNIGRPIVNAVFDSIVVTKKDILRINLITKKRRKCQKTRNGTVIMFLDEQAKMTKQLKKRTFELNLTDTSAFRMIRKNKKTVEFLKNVASERICQRVFIEMDAEERQAFRLF